MRTSWQRALGRTALALILGALTACGGATATEPLVTASAAPSAASSAPSAAPAAASPASAAGRFAALPQSKTAEGYYVLGNPDAPATITYYSDFI